MKINKQESKKPTKAKATKAADAKAKSDCIKLRKKSSYDQLWEEHELSKGLIDQLRLHNGSLSESNKRLNDELEKKRKELQDAASMRIASDQYLKMEINKLKNELSTSQGLASHAANLAEKYLARLKLVVEQIRDILDSVHIVVNRPPIQAPQESPLAGTAFQGNKGNL